jgi:T4 beta protein
VVTHSYVPIVKGKANDLKAVYDMSAAARSVTKAVIELTDLKDGQAADEALRGFTNRLLRYLPAGQIFVDLYSLPPNALSGNGKNATIAGFMMLADAGRRFTPVYGFELNDSLWPQLAVVTQRLKEGFCFRIDGDDLDDKAEETWRQVIERTAELRLEPLNIDLLIDLRFVGLREVRGLEELVLDFLLLRPRAFVPRSLAIAGSSALKEVSAIPTHGITPITRVELKLWARLQAELADTFRLIFGDYGIVNPEFTQVGANPYMNGKIRYTAADRIHYFRGSRLREPPGYAQYHTLARRVRDSEVFCGPEFSVGDKYIADCAARRDHPGSMGTWVWVDQNHHFEYTADQVRRVAPQVVTADTPTDAERLVALP